MNLLYLSFFCSIARLYFVKKEEHSSLKLIPYTVESSFLQSSIFFKLPMTRTESRFPFLVILPSISQTSRFLDPIFVSIPCTTNLLFNLQLQKTLITLVDVLKL